MSEPKVEVVTVTPDLARAWLKQNEANRSLRKHRVNEYAQSMADGLWKRGATRRKSSPRSKDPTHDRANIGYPPVSRR